MEELRETTRSDAGRDRLWWAAQEAMEHLEIMTPGVLPGNTDWTPGAIEASKAFDSDIITYPVSGGVGFVAAWAKNSNQLIGATP